MRLCPFHGCDAVLPPERFCCRQHWYSLSSPQRADINAAYRAWQSGKISGEELRETQQRVLGDRGDAYRSDP